MVSRSGQSTIPQYLCFQKPSPTEKDKWRQATKSQEKIFEYDEEQLDLSVFKKEYEEIQQKQMKLVTKKAEEGMNIK